MPISVTKVLMRILMGNLSGNIDIDINMLLNAAAKNKVLLHVLRVLNINNDLRAEQERAFKRFLVQVKEVHKALEGINYAFFKLMKPVIYVPADIDVLIGEDDVDEAVYKLSKMGYYVVVREPFTITVNKRKKDSFNVDLYINPSMGGIVYLDGSRLLRNAVTVNFYNISIPSLPGYIEALVVAAHALYKEWLYTLNDYITIKTWSDERTIKYAEELKCKSLLTYAEKLDRAIEQGYVELPYKVPLTAWARLWISKVLSDPLTRSTSINILRAIASRRGLEHLRLKIIRKTY